MSNSSDQPLRVLFCVGITQNFFELPKDQIAEVFEAFKIAFGGWEKRFGVKVLGTLDDDRVQVGQSPAGWPFTSYVMADAPNLDAVVQVCDTIRSTPVGDGLLWRYARIETRIGRPVFEDEGADG